MPYTAILYLVLGTTCVTACAVQVADTYLSIALLSTEELVASMAKPHTAVTDEQLKVQCTALYYYAYINAPIAYFRMCTSSRVSHVQCETRAPLCLALCFVQSAVDCQLTGRAHRC
jgi:hypothetical protein